MEVLVYTHDGKVAKTKVGKDFSFKDLLKETNDPGVDKVLIGDIMLASHSIYRVVPVESENVKAPAKESPAPEAEAVKTVEKSK